MYINYFGNVILVRIFAWILGSIIYLFHIARLIIYTNKLYTKLQKYVKPNKY